MTDIVLRSMVLFDAYAQDLARVNLGRYFMWSGCSRLTFR